MIDHEAKLKAAERVKVIVEAREAEQRASERDAERRRVFPLAANPREASRHHAIERRERLRRFAESLPKDAA